MTVASTIILDGMGTGKNIITEGFGPVSVFTPIMIEVTQELSDIVSAIPGPLEPELVGAYVNLGEFKVQVLNYTPTSTGVATVTPADIIVVWEHPLASIESALGITAPKLWEIMTAGVPLVLTVADSGTPTVTLAEINTPTMVQAYDRLVPSMLDVEGVTN